MELLYYETPVAAGFLTGPDYMEERIDPAAN
jgi:hypothetical protein